MSDMKFNNVTEAIHWKNSLLEKGVLLNGDSSFCVYVTCQYNKGYLQEKLKGTLEINGYNSGYIHLTDGKYLNVNSAPMVFWSSRQVYKYNQLEQCPIITGHHPTFLNYTVKIYNT